MTFYLYEGWLSNFLSRKIDIDRMCFACIKSYIVNYYGSLRDNNYTVIKSTLVIIILSL